MTSIKPLGRNILVQPVEEKEESTSGIVLPDSEKETTPQEGIVIALGDSKDIHLEIRKGVTVVFRQFSGDKVISDDVEYIVLDAKKDVVAVVAEK
jgi:chaperonin GroES